MRPNRSDVTAVESGGPCARDRGDELRRHDHPTNAAVPLRAGTAETGMAAGGELGKIGVSVHPSRTVGAGCVWGGPYQLHASTCGRCAVATPAGLAGGVPGPRSDCGSADGGRLHRRPVWGRSRRGFGFGERGGGRAPTRTRICSIKWSSRRRESVCPMHAHDRGHAPPARPQCRRLRDRRLRRRLARLAASLLPQPGRPQPPRPATV